MLCPQAHSLPGPPGSVGSWPAHAGPWGAGGAVFGGRSDLTEGTGVRGQGCRGEVNLYLSAPPTAPAPCLLFPRATVARATPCAPRACAHTRAKTRRIEATDCVTLIGFCRRTLFALKGQLRCQGQRPSG